MVYVKQQLQYLWNPQMIEIIFAPLFELILINNAESDSQRSSSSRKSSMIVSANTLQSVFKPDNSGSSINVNSSSSSWRNSFIGKAIEKASIFNNRSSALGLTGHCWNPVYKLGTAETSLIALICSLYENALNTLSQLRHDILAGLSYKELILPHLWQFITLIGPHNPCRAYLDYLNLHSKSCAPEFQILTIFCECATHLITILDDIELYENQKPFSIEDLMMISHFLNNFVFKLIWHNLIGLSFQNFNSSLIKINLFFRYSKYGFELFIEFNSLSSDVVVQTRLPKTFYPVRSLVNKVSPLSHLILDYETAFLNKGNSRCLHL